MIFHNEKIKSNFKNVFFDIWTTYASAYIETSQAVGVCANAVYSLYFNSEYASRKSVVKTSSKNLESLPRESNAPFNETGKEPILYSLFFSEESL